MHFPDSYTEDFFDQLTAEKVVTKYHHGHARRIWVKARPRNEALDCRVLNVAALGALLSMGLDLTREAANLAARVHAVEVGR
jgi:phage terminase large subunit GpA-like protein